MYFTICPTKLHESCQIRVSRFCFFSNQSILKFMSEDDDSLWDMATKDVKRLSKAQSITTPEKQHKKKKEQPVPSQSSSSLVLKELKDVQPREELKSSNRDVDKRTLMRFRKGQMAIEAKLDLHGKNQVEAQAELRDLILNSVSRGFRCVLVITGKGVGESGRRDPLERGQGVLRQKLPEWLEGGALASHVLQYVHARPQHGGDGAFYVLLRRQRS